MKWLPGALPLLGRFGCAASFVLLLTLLDFAVDFFEAVADAERGRGGRTAAGLFFFSNEAISHVNYTMKSDRLYAYLAELVAPCEEAEELQWFSVATLQHFLAA